MSPIDIIYKPVKKEDEIIERFFSVKIHLAYRPTFSENEKIDMDRLSNVIFVVTTTLKKINFTDTSKTVLEDPVTFIILTFKIC